MSLHVIPFLPVDLHLLSEPANAPVELLAHGSLGTLKELCDLADPHTLKVFEDKYHALAGRKTAEPQVKIPIEFRSHRFLFGIPRILFHGENLRSPADRTEVRFAAFQIIYGHIDPDPVDPGKKTRVRSDPEFIQIKKAPNENLLEELFCLMIIPEITVHEIRDRFSVANIQQIEGFPASIFRLSYEDMVALALRQIHLTCHRALYL
jgi:hypothetical protein